MPPPGGESFDAVRRRVRVARDKLLARYAGRTVLVVTHVTPTKMLVRDVLGAPLSAIYRMELSPASVTEIHWYAGRARRRCAASATTPTCAESCGDRSRDRARRTVSGHQVADPSQSARTTSVCSPGRAGAAAIDPGYERGAVPGRAGRRRRARRRCRGPRGGGRAAPPPSTAPVPRRRRCPRTSRSTRRGSGRRRQPPAAPAAPARSTGRTGQGPRRPDRAGRAARRRTAARAPRPPPRRRPTSRTRRRTALRRRAGSRPARRARARGQQAVEGRHQVRGAVDHRGVPTWPPRWWRLVQRPRAARRRYRAPAKSPTRLSGTCGGRRPRRPRAGRGLASMRRGRPSRRTGRLPRPGHPAVDELADGARHAPVRRRAAPRPRAAASIVRRPARRAEQALDATGDLRSGARAACRGRAGRLRRHDLQGLPARPVDADDVGTEVGQHHAGERRRADARQLEDPHARERSRHRWSLGSTSRPKTSIHSAWLRPTLCR